MTGLFIFGLLLILVFGLVVLRGAPYLPTLEKQLADAFDMLELNPGQTLLELGSGDGRMLAAAAKRGVYSVGYELNPLLVLWTRLRYWKYRKFISVRWGDFWLSDWPKTDGMYVFLLEKYMKKLDNKIIQYAKGKPYKVVSFGFEIPNRKVSAQRKGLRLYLYEKEEKLASA